MNLFSFNSCQNEYHLGRIYGPLDTFPVVMMSMATGEFGLPAERRIAELERLVAVKNGSIRRNASLWSDLETATTRVERLEAELKVANQHVSILTKENQHVAFVWGEVADWCREHVGDRTLMGRRVCDEVLRMLKSIPDMTAENTRLKKTLNDIRNRADLAVNHSP